MPINVTVQNIGSVSEVASVELFANSTLIFNGALSVDGSASGVLNCLVNTESLPIGNYTIDASVTAIGEPNVTPNTISAGTIGVTYVGDLTGDFKVDSSSFFAFISDYIAYWTTGYVNPAADFNHDGKMDTDDFVAFTGAYCAYASMQQQNPTSAHVAAHNYYINISGSNYQILNSASSVIYTSTSSSTAFNYLLGPSGIAPAGSTINVEAGAYTVDSTWNININSITVTFQTGTTLTATNAHNAGNDGIAINANNDIITGLTFNGNGLNQYPTPTTTLSSNTYDQMYNGISTHGANNALIENSTIYNWRCFGICIYDGNNNGVVGCTIYDIGANCLSDGIPCTNTYFVNNILYGCSDVGISFQGTNDIATENTLYQMNAASAPPMKGFQDSYWGIAFEENGGGSGNGNYALVAGNNVSQSSYGITLDGIETDYVIVSGNTVSNTDNSVVVTAANHSIIEYNTMSSSSSLAIFITANADNTNVYGNTYAGSAIGQGSGYILDSGTSTTYTAPTIVTITVTSTPTGTDYVTANGNAGYAGTNSNTPYTFYTTIGTTITLTANNPPGQTFTKWSDGGAQTHTITTPNTDTTYTATY